LEGEEGFAAAPLAEVELILLELELDRLLCDRLRLGDDKRLDMEGIVFILMFLRTRWNLLTVESSQELGRDCFMLFRTLT
jgi:hypothetical protein